MYIYIYACWCNMMCFENVNGIQVAERADSFRMQSSKVLFVLQVSKYSRFHFGKESLKRPWGSMGLFGRSPGVPGTSSHGSEAALAVAVCATDRFVTYTTGIMNLFVVSPQLQTSLVEVQGRGSGLP